MTAEGDGGKGREREGGKARRTDRGWPVNSRAEEKTIVFFSPRLGPSAISALGKEATELKTGHVHSSTEELLDLQYHLVYYYNSV